jgi:hypothetical protein
LYASAVSSPSRAGYPEQYLRKTKTSTFRNEPESTAGNLGKSADSLTV